MPVTIRKPSLQQPLIDNFTDEQLIAFTHCPYCEDQFYKSNSSRTGAFLEKQYLYHCRSHINSIRCRGLTRKKVLDEENFYSLLSLPYNLVSQASKILFKLNLTFDEIDQHGHHYRVCLKEWLIIYKLFHSQGLKGNKLYLHLKDILENKDDQYVANLITEYQISNL
jgi:hypothetical protein